MNNNTLAIKARIANHIRKSLYKKRLEQLTDKEKLDMFDTIFSMNQSAHWELNAYKSKRREKRELLKKRLAAPQTKTMKKKLRGHAKQIQK